MSRSVATTGGRKGEDEEVKVDFLKLYISFCFDLSSVLLVQRLVRL